MAIIEELLLFIHPTQQGAAAPLIDRLTRKMTAAFRQARLKGGYRGTHWCVCGARSTNCDYNLPNGEMTNSLCVHYLAHHRPEVPPEQLARVEALDCEEAESANEELQGPEWVLSSLRGEFESSLGPGCLGTWVEWGLDVTALCRALPGCAWPGLPGYEAGTDANELQMLLRDIRAEELPLIRQVLRQRYAAPEVWGADALRVPRKRGAWAELVEGLLHLPPGDFQGPRSPEDLAASIADCFTFQRPEDGVTIPAILELAKRPSWFQDHMVGNLEELGRIPGVLVPERAVPALVEVAAGADHDPRLRRAAERLLGCIG